MDRTDKYVYSTDPAVKSGCLWVAFCLFCGGSLVCADLVENTFRQHHHVITRSSDFIRRESQHQWTTPHQGVHTGEFVGEKTYRFDSFGSTIPAVTQTVSSSDGLPAGFSFSIEWDSFNASYNGETLDRLDGLSNVIHAGPRRVYGSFETDAWGPADTISGQITVNGLTESFTQPFSLPTVALKQPWAHGSYNAVFTNDDRPFVSLTYTGRTENTGGSGQLFYGMVDDTLVDIKHGFSGLTSAVDVPTSQQFTQAHSAAVPEPAAWMCLGLLFVGVVIREKWRNRKR